MEIKIIATGSTGNCVLLKSGDSSLLIEAGVSLSDIRKGTDYKLANVDGCLISHEHKDHSKSVKHLLTNGIECFMSLGTAEALEVLWHHNCSILRDKTEIGKWAVTPYSTLHDAAEPLMFTISDGDENLLFATDTPELPHISAKYDRIILECNWQNDMAADSKYSQRLYTSHMNFAGFMGALDKLDLRKLKELFIFHPSANHLDWEETVRKTSGLLYSKGLDNFRVHIGDSASGITMTAMSS